MACTDFHGYFLKEALSGRTPRIEARINGWREDSRMKVGATTIIVWTRGPQHQEASTEKHIWCGKMASVFFLVRGSQKTWPRSSFLQFGLASDLSFADQHPPGLCLFRSLAACITGTLASSFAGERGWCGGLHSGQWTRRVWEILGDAILGHPGCGQPDILGEVSKPGDFIHTNKLVKLLKGSFFFLGIWRVLIKPFKPYCIWSHLGDRFLEPIHLQILGCENGRMAPRHDFFSAKMTEWNTCFYVILTWKFWAYRWTHPLFLQKFGGSTINLCFE